MTFASIDSHKITTVKQGNANTFVTAILSRIREYRAERTELRSLYSHHNKIAANLAEAQRDVSRVWY